MSIYPDYFSKCTPSVRRKCPRCPLGGLGWGPSSYGYEEEDVRTILDAVRLLRARDGDEYDSAGVAAMWQRVLDAYRHHMDDEQAARLEAMIVAIALMGV